MIRLRHRRENGISNISHEELSASVCIDCAALRRSPLAGAERVGGWRIVSFKYNEAGETPNNVNEMRSLAAFHASRMNSGIYDA